MADPLIPIGELARRAAVPVKTVRHYSDIGVLPPAAETDRGYRMYGATEHLRLETVEALRRLGFALDEISDLTGDDDPSATTQVWLQAVRRRRRELGRIAVVLQAAIERSDDPPSTHVARLETLARLSDGERPPAPGDPSSTPVPDAPPVDDTDVLLPELPEGATPEQVDAWLDLVQLLADEGLRTRLLALCGTAPGSDGLPPRPPDGAAALDDLPARRYWRLVGRINR